MTRPTWSISAKFQMTRSHDVVMLSFQLATNGSEFETDRVKILVRGDQKISLLQWVWQTKFELPDSKFHISLVLWLHCNYTLPKQNISMSPSGPKWKVTSLEPKPSSQGSSLINCTGAICKYNRFIGRMCTMSCLKKSIHGLYL